MTFQHIGYLSLDYLPKQDKNDESLVILEDTPVRDS